MRDRIRDAHARRRGAPALQRAGRGRLPQRRRLAGRLRVPAHRHIIGACRAAAELLGRRRRGAAAGVHSGRACITGARHATARPLADVLGDLSAQRPSNACMQQGDACRMRMSTGEQTHRDPACTSQAREHQRLAAGTPAPAAPWTGRPRKRPARRRPGSAPRPPGPGVSHRPVGGAHMSRRLSACGVRALERDPRQADLGRHRHVGRPHRRHLHLHLAQRAQPGAQLARQRLHLRVRQRLPKRRVPAQ
jgi:hypothetical protein